MKCKLVKIGELSGDMCSVYSIILDDEDETLLDKFIKENIISFKSETKELISRLNTIGHKTGARIEFFKENEGNPGDGVCALYDENSNLRLYCIRYGEQLIILGSGGYKPKTIRALQEDKKLMDENYFLRDLSHRITQKIRNKEIGFSSDYSIFKGNLEFDNDEM